MFLYKNPATRLKRLASAALAFVLGASIGFNILPQAQNTVTAEERDTAEERTIAFPGAEGGGMYTTGARGALAEGKKIEVYHVTNLNDSGAGSFRDAVSKPNRIIVFDVGGVITLSDELNISQNNLTILGQTAPGGGICFYKNVIKISGNNIICRYLRFRCGDEVGTAKDGIGINGSRKNIILDHCSVSWGTDENIAVYAVKDVSVQWCIISEALKFSVHGKGSHSYTTLSGGVNLSFHHNLIVHTDSRNPRIATSAHLEDGIYKGTQDTDALIDFRNNVFYNWGQNSGYGGENGTRVNFINNYYKAGPDTLEDKKARIFEIYGGKNYVKGWGTDLRVNGNYMTAYNIDDTNRDYFEAVTADNIYASGNGGVDFKETAGDEWADRNNSIVRNDPHDISEFPIKTQSAEEAYEAVLNGAGVTLPVRDGIDARLVRETRAGEGRIIDSQAEVLGAGGIASVYPQAVSDAVDTDRDGMPDDWETEMGLDKDNPLDATSIAVMGYTWLEIYVNEILTNKSESRPEISLNLATDTVASGDSVTFSSTGNANEVKYYLNEEEVTETFTAVNPGVYYVTAAGYNQDSEYTISKPEILYIKPGADNETDWIHNDIGSPAKQGGFSESEMAISGSGKIGGTSDSFSYAYRETTAQTGDFDLILEANEIPRFKNGMHSGLMIRKTLDQDSEFIMASLEYNKYYKDILIGQRKTTGGEAEWSVMKDAKGAGVDASVNEAPRYMKLSRKGNELTISASSTLANWESDVRRPQAFNIEGYGDTLFLGLAVDSGGMPYSVLSFDTFGFIYGDDISAPEISFVDLEDGARIGGNSAIRLNVKADKAPVALVSIEAKAVAGTTSIVASNAADQTVITFEKAVNINNEGEATVDITGLMAAKYEFTASCVDKNLGGGAAKKTVHVSDNIEPWQLEDIGPHTGEAFVTLTADYTYKIDAPTGGVIGGTADSFAYMYQQFDKDIRLLYRHRIQNKGKQFGIMFRESLAPDSRAYYFYSEKEPDDSERGFSSNQGFKAMVRDTEGGEFRPVEINLSSGLEKVSETTALYFMVGKVGNKLNIYRSNSATNWEAGTYIGTIDIDLPETYYMGFAATTYDLPSNRKASPPDYMGMIEAVPESNKKGAIYDMDYGLDNYWISQETGKCLTPDYFTTNPVFGNNTGKIKISPDSAYTKEQFIYKRPAASGEMLEGGFNVNIQGGSPGLSLYLKTKANNNRLNAFRVTFSEDGIIRYHNNNQLIEFKDSEGNNLQYDTSGWYKVRIVTDAANKPANCNIYIYRADSYTGEYILKGYALNAGETTTTTYFRDVAAFANIPVLAAEPIAGAEGTYYLDDIYAYGYSRSDFEDPIADGAGYPFRVINTYLDKGIVRLEQTGAASGLERIIVYTASYSAADELIDVQKTVVPLNEFGSAVKDVQMKELNDTGAAKIKVFVWSEQEEPLTRVYTVNK